MPPSRYRLSDTMIDQVDQLLERMEAADASAELLDFGGCVADFKRITLATTTGLWLVDGNGHRLIAGDTSDAVIQQNLQLTPNTVQRVQSQPASALIARSVGTGTRIILQADFESIDQSAELDELLAAVVDAFASNVKSLRVVELERVLASKSRVDDFCRSLHEVRNLRQLSGQIATDGAAILGIDRLSVVQIQSGRENVLAVTGVADIDQKANETQFVAAVASYARKHADAKWQSSNTLAADIGCAELAPATARQVQVVADASNASCIAFVLECFDQAPVDSPTQQHVLQHAALAIRNVDELAQQGPRGLARRCWRKVRTRAFASFAIVSGLIALALAFTPVSFEIHCRGSLQPVIRQYVAAPSGGTIQRICENEQCVTKGELIVRIQNPQLELEESRLTGEIQTAKARLATLRAARGQVRADTVMTSQTEVTCQIEGLQAQLGVVQSEIKKLSVISQVDGVVFVNDLSFDLRHTVVDAGEKLVQVVDVDGAWRVDLRIPDKLVRHVLSAYEDKDQQVNVRMMLRTDTSIVFKGRLTEVGSAAHIDARNELTVPAGVEFSDANIELRPGSEVLANIDCGKRALGFVLFREVIEFVQSRILF